MPTTPKNATNSLGSDAKPTCRHEMVLSCRICGELPAAPAEAGTIQRYAMDVGYGTKNGEYVALVKHTTDPAGAWVKFEDVAPLLRERDELRTRYVMAKHARSLSLLGRSSEQEAREEGLREKLAIAQLGEETMTDAYHKAVDAADASIARAESAEAEVLRLRAENGKLRAITSKMESLGYLKPIREGSGR